MWRCYGFGIHLRTQRKRIIFEKWDELSLVLLQDDLRDDLRLSQVVDHVADFELLFQFAHAQVVQLLPQILPSGPQTPKQAGQLDQQDFPVAVLEGLQQRNFLNSEFFIFLEPFILVSIFIRGVECLDRWITFFTIVRIYLLGSSSLVPKSLSDHRGVELLL